MADEPRLCTNCGLVAEDLLGDCDCVDSGPDIRLDVARKKAVIRKGLAYDSLLDHAEAYDALLAHAEAMASLLSRHDFMSISRDFGPKRDAAIEGFVKWKKENGHAE